MSPRQDARLACVRLRCSSSSSSSSSSCPCSLLSGTVNAFLEFLPTVGLAMVVNLGRGYPDTVLAEKLLMHCWKPFSLHHLVVQLWYHQVIQERGLSALTYKYNQQIE
eukprot:COSAG01_NODE_120_length_25409_cov_20.648572_4_plen_108_part_00